MAGPCEGLLVLDFSWGMAGGLATAVLADFGAEVIKVEPPAGDPFRSHPAWIAWNRGKKGAVLDLKSGQGRSRAHQLVELADVVLGGEPAVEVPVHVLDAGFAAAPPSCPNPQPDPAQAGFTGILGVGVFREDCGPGCVGDAQNGVYFACTASGCAGAAVPLESQVQNPVAHLPLDNNGLLVELPAVAAGGAVSLSGSAILGIGTRGNNAPGAVTAFPLDGEGSFVTEISETTFPGSFLDTGSNGLFFAPPAPAALPSCGAPDGSWFCPPSSVDLTAINTPSGAGSPSASVSFQVESFDALLSSANQVFDDLGGTSQSGTGFDWGLPFYEGRRVVVGFEGASSALGSGPLVAY